MAKKWRNKNVREAFKNAINGIKYSKRFKYNNGWQRYWNKCIS